MSGKKCRTWANTVTDAAIKAKHKYDQRPASNEAVKSGGIGTIVGAVVMAVVTNLQPTDNAGQGGLYRRLREVQTVIETNAQRDAGSHLAINYKLDKLLEAKDVAQ